MSAAITQPLLRWYQKNARQLPWRQPENGTPDPYRVWVSEIMLQQTRVAAVIPYYQRFLEALPTVETLAACPEEKLLKLWEGLGYYSRARNLQKAARQVVAEHGGAFPASYEQLLKLPGFGPYTAGAVASIAFGLPVPAVDGNVLRVMSRLHAIAEDIALPATKAAVTELVRQAMPTQNAGAFTQALMELGALVCLPANPLCLQCPVEKHCTARAKGIERELPQKSPKRPRRAEDHTVFVLVCGYRTALLQRPAKGLLASLWQFPSAPSHLDIAEANRWLQNHALSPLQLQPLVPAKHIFTHVEWHMKGYFARVEKESPAFLWADLSDLENIYALPSAYRPFLEAAKQYLSARPQLAAPKEATK